MSNTSLFKNIAIYLSTDILNKILPFILLPILAKYLSLEEYGLMSNIQVLVFLFSIFFLFNSHSYLLVNYHKESSAKFNQVVSILVYTIPVFFIFWTVVVVIADYFDAFEVFGIESAWGYYLLFLVAFETVTSIYLNICISKENAASVSSIRIIKTVVEFSLSILLVVALPFSLTGRMGAILVGTTITAIWSFYKLSENFKKPLRSSLLQQGVKILAFSIPLIPHQISHWLKQGLDRLLITLYFGLSINAVYVVSFQLVSVILIMAVAINNAYSPYLFKLLAKENHPDKSQDILRVVYLFILVMTALCTALYFTLPYIFELILSEKYSEGVAIAQFLLIGIYFKSLYYSVVGFIIFHEKTKILTVITFSSSLLYISLFYALKSTFGLNALPVALAVAELLSLFAVLFYSNKLNPLPWFKSLSYVSK